MTNNNLGTCTKYMEKQQNIHRTVVIRTYYTQLGERIENSKLINMQRAMTMPMENGFEVQHYTHNKI